MDKYNPSFEVCYSLLINQGFSLQTEGIDVPILAKYNGDTLTYFQFGIDRGEISKKPLSMYTKFKINYENTEGIKNLFKEDHLLILNNLSHIDYDQTFYLKNIKNNLFFECSIESEKEQDYLVIKFSYPQYGARMTE